MNRNFHVCLACIIALVLTFICAATPVAFADPSDIPPPVIPNPPPDKGSPLLDLALLLEHFGIVLGL